MRQMPDIKSLPVMRLVWSARYCLPKPKSHDASRYGPHGFSGFSIADMLCISQTRRIG
jgi:hypothetical protein